MGFDKRYISDESIFAAAKNYEFSEFDSYMLKADAYTIEGDVATCLWNFYHEERDSRRLIWNILRNEGEDKDRLIQSVCKSWSMSNNDKNRYNQMDTINSYLDLMSSLGNSKQLKKSMNSISNILKRRIKNKI